ncbi:MAG TPA: radical SAM protein [Geminicoccus sp.]|jgi:molybdenum cofactor biosynthesis enzyme MoaA|uniref:radical SAM protein n=1 Tax=Geminicoccus sp. TaxID=2024832 RepID=UPI002E359301|nr:radical SAM protein [Geminicoccus sp.]HEX2529546.1 radical SAM protein [Geminicoccus sp.]
MDLTQLLVRLRKRTAAIDHSMFVAPALSTDVVPPDPIAAVAEVEDELDQEIGPAEWAFLEEAAAHPVPGKPLPRVLLVILARRALAAGEARKGMEHALAALAREQRDMAAQDVYLRARHAAGEGPAPVDPRGRFCAKPWRELELRPDLSGHACCPSWLAVPIGMADGAGGAAFWNSAAAQAIRSSVLDGSFTWCSRLHCPHITAEKLPRREDVRNAEMMAVMAEKRTQVDHGPARVLLNYDRSCNLACPSCRRERIVADQEERDRLDDVADRVVLPLLKDAQVVKATGSGDPFASAHFRRLLKRLDRQSYPRLRLQLQTNGLLCDERAWEELDLEGRVDALWVSVDAAVSDTYAVIRKFGSWERLRENLMFMAKLRVRGGVREWRLDFVVQALNYREMPAATELARGLGADGIHFHMIRNWGTFTPQAFREHLIASPDHPEHAQFLETLRHPALDWPQVDWSDLTPLRRQMMPARAA